MDYKEVIFKKRIRLGYSRNKLSQLIGHLPNLYNRD